jgi:hypothetical protein
VSLPVRVRFLDGVIHRLTLIVVDVTLGGFLWLFLGSGKFGQELSAITT